MATLIQAQRFISRYNSPPTAAMLLASRPLLNSVGPVIMEYFASCHKLLPVLRHADTFQFTVDLCLFGTFIDDAAVESVIADLYHVRTVLLWDVMITDKLLPLLGRIPDFLVRTSPGTFTPAALVDLLNNPPNDRARWNVLRNITEVANGSLPRSTAGGGGAVPVNRSIPAAIFATTCSVFEPIRRILEDTLAEPNMWCAALATFGAVVKKNPALRLESVEPCIAPLAHLMLCRDDGVQRQAGMSLYHLLANEDGDPAPREKLIARKMLDLDLVAPSIVQCILNMTDKRWQHVPDAEVFLYYTGSLVFLLRAATRDETIQLLFRSGVLKVYARYLRIVDVPLNVQTYCCQNMTKAIDEALRHHELYDEFMRFEHDGDDEYVDAAVGFSPNEEGQQDDNNNLLPVQDDDAAPPAAAASSTAVVPTTNKQWTIRESGNLLPSLIHNVRDPRNELQEHPNYHWSQAQLTCVWSLTRAFYHLRKRSSGYSGMNADDSRDKHLVRTAFIRAALSNGLLEAIVAALSRVRIPEKGDGGLDVWFHHYVSLALLESFCGEFGLVVAGSQSEDTLSDFKQEARERVKSCPNIEQTLRVLIATRPPGAMIQHLAGIREMANRLLQALGFQFDDPERCWDFLFAVPLQQTSTTVRRPPVPAGARKRGGTKKAKATKAGSTHQKRGGGAKKKPAAARNNNNKKGKKAAGSKAPKKKTSASSSGGGRKKSQPAKKAASSSAAKSAADSPRPKKKTTANQKKKQAASAAARKKGKAAPKQQQQKKVAGSNKRITIAASAATKKKATVAATRKSKKPQPQKRGKK